MPFKKGNIPWNKNKKGVQTAWNKGKTNVQEYTEERNKRISQTMKGQRTNEENNNWKGDEVNKGAIHGWLWRHYGEAKEHKCEHCGKQAQDWANIDHSYKRIREDYMTLCRSCHQKWDYKYNGRRNQYV